MEAQDVGGGFGGLSVLDEAATMFKWVARAKVSQQNLLCLQDHHCSALHLSHINCCGKCVCK